MNSKNNKRLIIIILIVATILLIPFIAMQFTNEVNWTTFDFTVAGLLLLTTGLCCEFVLRRVNDNKKRMLMCFVLLLVLFIVWIELAVGIF